MAEKELAQLRKLATAKHDHPGKEYDYDCLTCAAAQALANVDDEIKRAVERHAAGLRAKEQANG